jgi:hypothetical protein
MNREPLTNTLEGKASDIAPSVRAQGNFDLAAVLDDLGDHWVRVEGGEIVDIRDEAGG